MVDRASQNAEPGEFAVEKFGRNDGFVKSRIYTVRGVQVMLDRDLAELYWVSTGALNQAVKRNINRFPERFMFQLSEEEFKNWKSQIVMSNLSDAIISKIETVHPEGGRRSPCLRRCKDGWRNHPWTSRLNPQGYIGTPRIRQAA